MTPAPPHIPPHITRTFEKNDRTHGNDSQTGQGLKAIAGAALRRGGKCAHVRTPMRAHPHICSETRTYPRTSSAHLPHINPVALSWLAENRAVLRAAGWTMAELYRRNKSRGIAWVSLWDHPGLEVVIESGGCISFHFLTATGKKIRQTAWPKKHQRKRSSKI